METTSSLYQTPLEGDHPLARLLAAGSDSLSNGEVLALLLGGTTSTDLTAAAELARHILSKVRSLDTLARSNAQELAALTGVSPVQVAQIVAAGEFGRRVAREYGARLTLDDPAKVCQLMLPDYRGRVQESVCVLLLNTKAQLLRIEEIALGSLNASIAHPVEVFRAAIVHGACSIILTHNHPSGDPSPSVEDQRLTPRLVEAGKVLGIRLDDHVIIGGMRADGPSYYSFKEHGAICR